MGASSLSLKTLKFSYTDHGANPKCNLFISIFPDTFPHLCLKTLEAA